MTRIMRPEPLTAEAFLPFGQVIAAEAATGVELINEGLTRRFHGLAAVEASAGGGKAVLSIFRGQPMAPLILRRFERHPLGSQSFMPLSPNPYLVAVAPFGAFDARAVRLFLAAAGQGVHYPAGLWHHFLLPLAGVSDFLVIDREGPGNNLEEASLAPDDVIEVRL